MTQAQLPYVLLYLCSTFLASVSQVLLKKAALREHKSLLAEYTDWRVILGYGLFVGCSLLTMLAYKGVPLNIGPVLEATGYLYVTVFGVTIFHEKMNPKKIGALALILLGILVYAWERSGAVSCSTTVARASRARASRMPNTTSMALCCLSSMVEAMMARHSAEATGRIHRRRGASKQRQR